MDEIKKECKWYYAQTITKVDDNGRTLYATLPIKGTKILPLGYYDSEEIAISTLHSYLSANGFI